ncbi:MAG: zinc transporter ZntB [Rhodospirillales bacterium]|nr:zinc transporter ZntB [Rhodospirillales bacterium]
MSQDDALVHAHILDGRGGSTAVGWTEIAAWTPEQGVLWVHLDIDQPESRAWIEREPALGEMIAGAVTEAETRPRSVAMKDGLLVILRGITHIPGPEPNQLVSLRMWLNEARVVSGRRWQLTSVDLVRRTLDYNDGPRTSAELLVALAEHLTDSVTPAIDELEDMLDVVEMYLPEAKDTELANDLAGVRRQAIQMRRHMGPQRDAIAHLLIERAPWLGESERAQLREVRDQASRHLEDLDATRERAQIAQDQLASRSRQQLQRTMYILAVVTALFMPLTFITGLLGMNVGGIPGGQSPFGFVGVLVVMILVFVVLIWVFRRMNLIR